jgi:hypothetical protein
MALIFAGIVAVLTVAWCVLVLFANGMAATGEGDIPALSPFVIGMSIAGLIASLHWLPL